MTLTSTIEYISLTITSILLILFIVAVRNIFRFSRLQVISQERFNTILRNKGLHSAPLVSVLVPARNEERLIRECVQSLAQQEYVNAEIVVLNDKSTDRTGEILQGLSQQYPHVRIVQGGDLPDGWVGKNYACHTLASHAQGEYLLFTDADTIHKPHMLQSAVAMMLEQKLDFISMIPNEEMISWGEKIIIPMIHFLYFAYLPNDIITKSQKASVSAANGQFMFFSRKAYDYIGGHTIVKNNIVEDVFLAKEIKKNGLRMALVDGTQSVTCRMYTSFKEAFEGFSKNLFAGFSFHLPTFVIFLLHLLLLYIIPFLTVVYAIIYPEPPNSILYLSIINIVIPVCIRLIMAYRFRLSISASLLHVITVFSCIAIGINSLRWTYSKRGIQWKGREYKKQSLQ